MTQDASLASFSPAVDPTGVFALIGDFDLSNCHELEAEIARRLRANGSACLDFSQCSYIDSSILTVLVRAVRTYGDRLQMVVPVGGTVARLLEVTKLDRIFPIVS